jgi:tyrosine aminotransferase
VLHYLKVVRALRGSRYDKHSVFADGGVLRGIKQLTQIIVGPNSLMQSALPTMLQRTPVAFYEETMATLKEHAE